MHERDVCGVIDVVKVMLLIRARAGQEVHAF
jgi:hypothetical protein